MERFFQEIWVAKFPWAELVLGEDNKLHHVKCIFVVVKCCESNWCQNWMASISRMGGKNVFTIFQGKKLVSLSKLYHPTSKN
jgi:hypothetical protein